MRAMLKSRVALPFMTRGLWSGPVTCVATAALSVCSCQTALGGRLASRSLPTRDTAAPLSTIVATYRLLPIANGSGRPLACVE